MTETIYILLPVHNRRNITRRFIECLEKQTVQNYHLVLIDDGSTDGTEEMVRCRIKPLTVLNGKGNWWWAGSLQKGYLWLKSKNLPLDDVVLIINDDTEFGPEFLQTAINILSLQNKTLLLAQCYSRSSQQLIDAGVHVDWESLRFEQAGTQDRINCLSTRGLFFRISDFYDIGGFFPKLLPHYVSDYEFTIRAHRRGMKLITDTALILWVNEKTTGYYEFDPATPFIKTMKTLFSKKYQPNPIYWSLFLVLSCPWRWKLLNLISIWCDTLMRLLFYANKRRRTR